MLSLLQILLILNFCATLYMTGVIWMVQLVHYPLMAKVGDGPFIEYHQRHTRMMGLTVGPPMLIEAFTSVLLIARMGGYQFWPAITGAALVVVIWLSTALLQVPCHMKLEQGFDPRTHRFLVKSNWIRTWAWSMRAVLVAWLMLTAGRLTQSS